VIIQQPLVSIVTPSYNQVEFLEKTIRSVLDQDYPNIEYIIIDGGSTDGSVDIIKRYEDRLAYWVSESDRGQSHAINKGWQRASGDVVAYLNSDDLYTPGAVTAAVRALVSKPIACMVYSDSLLINGQGAPIGKRKSRPFNIREQIVTGGLVPQPTAFIKRWALDQIGLLDEQLHMVMDYEFWIRLGLRYPISYLPDIYLAKMREHPEAKSFAAVHEFPIERRLVLDKLFSEPSVPPHIRRLRKTAYCGASFEQAVLAAYVDQPCGVWRPLLRAVIESPAYVLAERPLDSAYLLTRGLLPWWKRRPSPT